MTKTILITGGAGFIGSHVADELLEHGYNVRVLDAMVSQVHGEGAKRPDYLAPDAELLTADVRDTEVVREALVGVDAVLHLAALVGVGQSMYELARYTSVNNYGTAVLLEALIEQPVERLVVASSMSIYGEGLYRGRGERLLHSVQRTPEQLARGEWELSDGAGGVLEPLPTPETKMPWLESVYALSKYDQERLCLMTGRAYDIPSVALRLFNVYGTRQALSNPYTGVLAIFAARLLNDRAPIIFEDGEQQRDFVSVADVARAFRLALERPEAEGRVFNIGSGEARTVRSVAADMARVLGKEEIEPEVTGEYRVGDIRHCFADIRLAQEVLGYQPRVRFQEGLRELAQWLRTQVAVDRVDQARTELSQRGLTL